MDSSTNDLLERIKHHLEEATLKPGEKMVFGRVVKTKKGGKMDAKTRWKTKRKRARSRAAGSKKGYGREVARQVAHQKSRGVKKQRGMKESMLDLLASLSE